MHSPSPSSTQNGRHVSRLISKKASPSIRTQRSEAFSKVAGYSSFDPALSHTSEPSSSTRAELTSVGHFDFQFALGGQGTLLSGLGAQSHFTLGTPFETGRILQHQPHSVVGRHHHLGPLHRHTHLLQLREGVRLGQHPGLTNHQNHGGNDRSRTSGQGRARHPASPHTAANASFHVVEVPAVRTGTIVRRLQPGPDAVQQLFIVLIEIPMRKIGSFHNTG